MKKPSVILFLILTLSLLLSSCQNDAEPPADTAVLPDVISFSFTEADAPYEGMKDAYTDGSGYSVDVTPYENLLGGALSLTRCYEHATGFCEYFLTDAQGNDLAFFPGTSCYVDDFDGDGQKEILSASASCDSCYYFDARDGIICVSDLLSDLALAAPAQHLTGISFLETEGNLYTRCREASDGSYDDVKVRVRIESDGMRVLEQSAQHIDCNFTVQAANDPDWSFSYSMRADRSILACSDGRAFAYLTDGRGAPDGSRAIYYDFWNGELPALLADEQYQLAAVIVQQPIYEYMSPRTQNAYILDLRSGDILGIVSPMTGDALFRAHEADPALLEPYEASSVYTGSESLCHYRYSMRASLEADGILLHTVLSSDDGALCLEGEQLYAFDAHTLSAYTPTKTTLPQ